MGEIVKRIKQNDTFIWKDRYVNPRSVRDKLNNELNSMKNEYLIGKGDKRFAVSLLACKFNITRTRVGHLLSERSQEQGDIVKVPVSGIYQSSMWEFI